MQRCFKLILAYATLSTSCAFAGTLVVTSTGTFSSSTPTSSISAPDETYSLSFAVSSAPTVATSSAGNYFNVPFTDFSYTIDGVASTSPVGSITFYNSAVSGLLTVCFTAACPGDSVPTDGLVFEGAQAYSGSEAAPTILAGDYSPSLQGVVVNGSPNLLSSDAPLGITAAPASVTPEPSSVALLGTGFLGLAGVLKRRLSLFKLPA